MSEELKESTPPAETANLMPEAPNLSYEDACALVKRNGRLISEDDIELVVLVTLHNEIMRLTHENLQAHQRLAEEGNKKHRAAMTEIMKRAADDLRKGVAVEKDAFTSAVRSVALENVTALISQHQKDMAEHRQTIRVCTFLCCACLALTVFLFLR